MKVGIYTPYLDTTGGGEKYMLTIAEMLSVSHEVYLLLDSHLSLMNIGSILKKAEILHNLDLSKIKTEKAPLGKASSFLDRLFYLKKFDYLFYLTDGSFFYSTAKKNVIHFQFPITNISSKGIWGKLKLSSWNLAIFNSKFTQEKIEKNWNIKGKVVYPPVNVSDFKSLKKKNQIVSVGRFYGYLKDKKQQLLIDVFKNLVDEEKIRGWSLHLAGSMGESDKDYVEELKKSAKGYPIFIYPNLPFLDLVRLYGESKIYWHALGYGQKEGQKMEHFGITTVEAMASGCVPVVINSGGQKEIVENRVNGFLWNDIDELKEFTLELIEDINLWEKISNASKEKAGEYSKEQFRDNIFKIVNE